MKPLFKPREKKAEGKKKKPVGFPQLPESLRKDPLKALFRCSVFDVTGAALRTAAGVFWGMRENQLNVPIGREVAQMVDSGIIAIHFVPAQQSLKELLARLMAEYSSLQAKNAPASVLQRLKTAISSIRNKPEAYCLVSVSGIGRPQAGGPPADNPNISLVPPLLRTIFSPHVPLYQGCAQIDVLEDFVHVPTVQKVRYPLPFAQSFYGDTVHFPIGTGPQNAQHILILGATGSGKSTTVKVVMKQIIKEAKEVVCVATDLKGEYSLSKTQGLFGYHVVSVPELRCGLGYMTLREFHRNGDFDERVVHMATLEAHAASLFLSHLGYAVNEATIEALIRKACVEKRFSPEEGVEKIFRALSSKLNIPSDYSIVKQFLGSPEAPDFPEGNVIVDFSVYPYRSEIQVAVFLFMLLYILETLQPPKDTLLALLIEEAHLIPANTLNMLLRLLRAKGISLTLVTQSIHEIQKLQGGQEQFSHLFYLLPTEAQLANALNTLYGRELPLPLYLKEAIANLPRQPGNGVYVPVSGNPMPFRVHVDEETLREIERFNERARLLGRKTRNSLS